MVGKWNGKVVTSLNVINSRGNNKTKKIEDFEYLNLVVAQIWNDTSLSIFSEDLAWFIINELVNNKNKKIMPYIRRVRSTFDIDGFIKFSKIKRINPNNVEHVMLRDNISLENAKKVVENYKSKTAGSKDNFVNRHGEVEGIKRFKEFQNKSMHTEKRFIARYGTELGLSKYKEYLSKKDSNSIDYFIRKFGDTLGKIKFENNKIEKKYLSSEEYYIIKYGKFEGTKIFFDISKSKGRDKNYYISEYGEEYYLENILKPKLSYLGQEFVIPFNEQSDFQEYSRKVRRLTEKQKLFNIDYIDQRGKLFHLDHKFSVANGFLHNVPIYIIADISNLEIIPAKENLEKHTKNSMELEELYNRYKHKGK